MNIMKKTKSFTQYSDTNFSIRVSININGNINFRSHIQLYSEYAREQFKKHYEENKEEINKKRRKYREENREKINKMKRKYYQNNKEKINKWHKIYIKTKNGILSKKREYANRKEFGFNPINDYFDGAHFHHTHENDNHDIGIFIPEELHRSIGHSHKDKESMNKINTIAYKWLKEQYIGE